MLAAHHWSWDPPTGSGDYAQYLSHARALVEGRHYTDIGYIYHRSAPMVGPRAYPPGLPVTLAPIVAFAGINLPLIRMLMLITALAFAYIAYRRLALSIAPWQAAVASGISAFTIEAGFGTLVPLSDVGMCALMWATVWAVDRGGAWTWRRVAVVTLLGFAAMAYRVAAVALAPALALYAIVDWQRHKGRALVPVAIWVGSGLAVVISTSIELPFADFLIPRLSGIVGRAQQTLRVYPFAALGAQLYPFAWDLPNDIYHVLASILMLAGTVALLWRLRRTMLTATAIMYVCLLAGSPATSSRYIWPLLPVLAAGFVVGLTTVCRAIAGRFGWVRRAPGLAALVLAFVMIGALARELRTQALPSDYRDSDVRALFAWLANLRTRERVRVVYSNPRVLTLETRVPAMAALFAKPADHLAAMYDMHITHLVWPTATPGDCRSRLAHELPGLYPDRFVLEYENAGYRVYRLVNSTKPIPPIEGYQPAWGGNRCNPNRADLEERR